MGIMQFFLSADSGQARNRTASRLAWLPGCSGESPDWDSSPEEKTSSGSGRRWKSHDKLTVYSQKDNSKPEPLAPSDFA